MERNEPDLQVLTWTHQKNIIEWKYISELYTAYYYHLLETYKMLLHIFHGPLYICKYLQRYIYNQNSNYLWKTEWRVERN